MSPRGVFKYIHQRAYRRCQDLSLGRRQVLRYITRVHAQDSEVLQFYDDFKWMKIAVPKASVKEIYQLHIFFGFQATKLD